MSRVVEILMPKSKVGLRTLSLRWHGRGGYGAQTAAILEVAQVAVETHYWPLYEVDGGRWRITVRPARVRPVADWLEMQGRFKHLVKAPDQVESLQKWVDANWAALEAKVACVAA